MHQTDHDILITIKSVLDRMDLRLFGEDGTQGELGAMKIRTTNLEEFKSKLIGALALLSVAVSTLGGIQIYHIITGK